MTDRDYRIETYYHESAWDLAEKIVDLEDELKKVKQEHSNMENFQYALEAAGVHDWVGWKEAWARFDSGDF